MEVELVNHCCDLDAARAASKTECDLRMCKLWYAAYALRSRYVPEMPDTHVESITELSYLATLPAFRHIAMREYTSVIQWAPKTYQTLFARMVALAKHLNTHGTEQIATDEDWETWFESM